MKPQRPKPERNPDNSRPWWSGARQVRVEVERDHGVDLAEQAFRVYQDILAEARGAYLFRMWNRIPRINEGEGDEESYRRFCVGRLRAFEQAGVRPYPVATAVGSDSDRFMVEAWFTEAQGVPVPNPWQQEAFHYPPCYGPASPSFSRAMLWPGNRSLWLAGTAAIRGHQSTFPNDLCGQLQCTTENIGILVQEAGRRFAIPAFAPRSLRAYVRHAEHVPQTARHLADWAPKISIDIEVADICRRELLVEVEGVFEADG